ncbi:MAG: YjbE family putative metal transport protein [Pseudomonadales bacterium]
MFELLADYAQIVIADLVLSGDNALIIGMAAAGLPAEQRKKAIFYGMLVAAGLRVVFALIVTQLLGIPGILFIGACLLYYVCWRLYVEIRENANAGVDLDNPEVTAASPTTLKAALLSILIADVSMSLDNVLAVAAIADGDTQKLVIGLGLAIVLMAVAATFIMQLLVKYRWISWVGLIVLVYVSSEMMLRGIMDIEQGILPLLGWVEGWDL